MSEQLDTEIIEMDDLLRRAADAFTFPPTPEMGAAVDARLRQPAPSLVSGLLQALRGWRRRPAARIAMAGGAAASVFVPGEWVLMVLGGVSHVVQASTYEFQRQMYDYWVFGKESAHPVMPEEFRQGMKGKKGFSRFFGGALLTYLSIQSRVAGADPLLIAQFECMKEEGEGKKVSEVYRSTNLSAVKTWSILCSNYRTMAVFIACLAKNPLYFFLFEIGFLNVALVSLRMMQARRNQQLLSRLSNCTDAVPQDVLAAA